MKKIIITTIAFLISIQSQLFAGHGSVTSFLAGALTGTVVTSMAQPRYTSVYVTPSTSTYTTYENQTQLVPVYDSYGNIVRYQETLVKVPKTVTVTTPTATVVPLETTTVVPNIVPPPIRFMHPLPPPPPPRYHRPPPPPPPRQPHHAPPPSHNGGPERAFKGHGRR